MTRSSFHSPALRISSSSVRKRARSCSNMAPPSAHAGGIQHDLLLLALAEALDAGAELLERHLGGDEVADVHALLQQVEHLLPRAEHLAADHRVHRQALEDEVLAELLDA